jgi:hypothetical protein
MTIASFAELLLGMTIICATVAIMAQLVRDATSVSVTTDTARRLLPSNLAKRQRRLSGYRIRWLSKNVSKTQSPDKGAVDAEGLSAGSAAEIATLISSGPARTRGAK